MSSGFCEKSCAVESLPSHLQGRVKNTVADAFNSKKFESNPDSTIVLSAARAALEGEEITAFTRCARAHEGAVSLCPKLGSITMGNVVEIR